jgi:V/A-type H+-transporting ATPase subunit C
MSRMGGAGINPIKAGASPHFREGRVKGLPPFLSVDLKRIKPFSEVTRYGYAVGRIRVLEMQMLNSQRMERLIDADFEGALNVLDETTMGDFLAEASTAREVEAGITAFLRDVYASITEALPPGSFLLDFFLCRYDFHNLKALLKARMEGEKPQGLLEGLGTVGLEALSKGVKNPADLPSPYKEVVVEAEDVSSSQELDTLVDKEYLSHRLFLARREGSPFVIDYARASIDLANLKLVLRGRLLAKEKDFIETALVGGGFVAVNNLLDLYGDPPEVMMKKLEANLYYAKLLEMVEDADEVVRLTDFDRRSDDRLMEMIKGTKRISVGAEPVFAYLRARENEALMVRMILIAKLHNIPPSSIEKMVRKLYIE